MHATIDQIADAWDLWRKVHGMSRKREAMRAGLPEAHGNLPTQDTILAPFMKGGGSMGDLFNKATDPERAAAKGEVVALIVTIIEALLGKPEEVRRRYAKLIERMVCPETREPVGKLARMALRVE